MPLHCFNTAWFPLSFIDVLFLFSFHFMFPISLDDTYSKRRGTTNLSAQLHFLVFTLSCIPFTIFPLILLVSGSFFGFGRPHILPSLVGQVTLHVSKA
ncbi:uncharacterized protein BO80DRAFT_81988 [Aspergillus ibericus CBS 121593]|uniref:Uncharacterized protein n=1 Tax=Aspergillus ibericus CBS 121593 TaxID=1448316 RepID=A0A395HCX3_9EURO|nr:hypothetical protein BO80DRAFT_81988 [Aspergillus ibericus CBS 121593]RAL05811.1 hypothetical protein BO80DRAFT_81988 [Aspergillus ibericus CBS 121593]